MNNEKFITWEELEEMETVYTTEDNGMSGQHYGYHWYTATNDETGEVVELYVK